MEHGDHAAKARAKPTDGLRGKRDLRNQDARRLPLLEDALDGRKIDLRLAGSGDSVDQDDVATPRLQTRIDFLKRALLPVGKRFWSGGTRGRQRGLVAQATPCATLVHPYHALFRQRANGRGHIRIEEIELPGADGAAGERLDQLALAVRIRGRGVVRAIRRNGYNAFTDGMD